MQNLDIGDIVKSMRGRDANNIYIISRKEGDFVYLVDGKNKTIEKPKKKKIKHIKPTNQFDSGLKEKWLNNKRILDAEIRKALKNFENVI